MLNKVGLSLLRLSSLSQLSRVFLGFCIPRNPENVCSIIRGTANIYLDSEVTEARDIAYTALDEALADPTFVVLFEPNVVHSRFLGSVQENVILVPIEAPSPVETTTTPSSIKIAIAISSVVFVVASIFSFGFLRRQTKLNACRQQADLQRQQRRKSGRELRRYFQTLDSDDGTVDGPVHQMTTDQDCRSVTWSDLTSDSGSVQSIISRTTSRLHKIEEEPDHEKHAEVEATWDAQEMPLSSHYTAAYVAHKSRLREIVKDACSEDRDDGEERITPKMEDSFPTSFGSDDLLFPDAFQSPTGRSEQASDLSSLSNYYTPKSGKTHAGFISEVASELTMDEHLGSNVFNGSYESATDQYPELNVSIGSAGWAVIENPELNVSTGSPLRGLNLNRSMDTNDSGASLQRWLTRLLLELNMSQQVKRIEL